MTIAVHFYSISKDLAGEAARPLVVPDRSTLGHAPTLADALEILFHAIPALAPVRASCLYAVGTSYAPLDAVLSAGDVISIIPPMQGG